MRFPTTRTFVTAMLATLILASGVVPALASPPRAPQRFLAAARPMYRPGPAAVEEVQERLLPMGGSLTDYMDANGNFLDVWSVPLHQSQRITVQIKVPRGVTMGASLWSNDQESEDPLAAVAGEDGQTLTLGYTAPADGTDWYHIVLATVEGAGRYTMSYDLTDPSHVSDTQRISGADRITTAVEVSKVSYPTGASTVVVATGWNFADALAASGLCGSYDAPLLLTRPTSLPSEVTAEIQRLGATQVFVIGSDKAVSSSVFSALQGGGRTVERLEGGTRFETAAAIAQKIKQHELAENRPFTGSAFIVNGMNFPDALAVAPYAFKQRIPILPVLAGSVPPATQDALASLGTTEAILVGGESVVSNSVLSALNVSSKLRVHGPGRTETAIAAADFAVGRGWASWDYIGLATGWNFPDALGGGANVGKNGGVMLLSNPLYLNSSPYQAIRGTNSTYRLFGSGRALSGCVIGDIDFANDPGSEFDEIFWQE